MFKTFRAGFSICQKDGNASVQVFAQVVGKATLVLSEEVLETRANSFELLEGRGGGPGDDGGTTDRVDFAGDIDFEIDRRARRVVAEPSEQHAGFRDVFGLAEGPQGPFLEVEDDPGGRAKREARRDG